MGYENSLYGGSYFLYLIIFFVVIAIILVIFSSTKNEKHNHSYSEGFINKHKKHKEETHVHPKPAYNVKKCTVTIRGSPHINKYYLLRNKNSSKDNHYTKGLESMGDIMDSIETNGATGLFTLTLNSGEVAPSDIAVAGQPFAIPTNTFLSGIGQPLANPTNNFLASGMELYQIATVV